MTESAPDERSPALPPDTARLTFAGWRLEDAPEAYLMYGDPEVARYIGGQPEADVAAMRTRLEAMLARRVHWPQGQGSFPARSRSDGRLVGTGLLKPLPGADDQLTEDVEIGWHVMRADWGQGYATEMGRALCRFGFGFHGLARLHVVVEPANVASQAVARKLGCQHQGRTTRYYGGLELESFTLDAADWRA